MANFIAVPTRYMLELTHMRSHLPICFVLSVIYGGNMFCIAHLRAEKKRSLNIVLSRFRPFSLDLYMFLRFMCFASTKLHTSARCYLGCIVV